MFNAHLRWLGYGGSSGGGGGGGGGGQGKEAERLGPILCFFVGPSSKFISREMGTKGNGMHRFMYVASRKVLWPRIVGKSTVISYDGVYLIQLCYDGFFMQMDYRVS